MATDQFQPSVGPPRLNVPPTVSAGSLQSNAFPLGYSPVVDRSSVLRIRTLVGISFAAFAMFNLLDGLYDLAVSKHWVTMRFFARYKGDWAAAWAATSFVILIASIAYTSGARWSKWPLAVSAIVAIALRLAVWITVLPSYGLPSYLSHDMARLLISLLGNGLLLPLTLLFLVVGIRGERD